MKNLIRFSWIPLAVAALAPSIASAQVDVLGDYSQPGNGMGRNMAFFEESQDRGTGPDPGDYSGLPINDAVRFKASLYSPDWLSVPEHQCIPHPSTYQDRSPGGLSVSKEYDPITQKLLAYHTTGNYGLYRTIWMDGRPHPSETALHTFEGFSTGHWDGNKLIVETTHLKAGWVRRNGVAHSDRAKMTEYFVRHDDYMTIILSVDDPTYLAEPFVRSTDLKINPRALTRLIEYGGFWNGGTGPVFYKCGPADEIDVRPGFVPSFMPGKNTELNTFSKDYKVPMEASLGGTITMYPEYMARLRQLASGQVKELTYDKPQPMTVAQSPSTKAPSTKAAAKPAKGAKAPETPSVAVSSMQVNGKVWMVTAGGQNIAVQIGDEGVLVVDPGPAETAQAALAEVRRISGNKPIHIIVNTSSDPQRVGGNAVFAAGPTPTSQTAAIYAQENVGLRMAEANAPSAGTPTEAFNHGTRQIYFNDEPVDIIYQANAHTDGDVIVFFRKSDVVVAGGIVDDVSYPTINTKQGGTLQGEVAALNNILAITTPSWRSEYGTRVIPSRGHLYDEGDVAEYRDAMTIIRDRFLDALAKGESAEQIRADGLTRDYDVRYGDSAGQAGGEVFVKTAYASLGSGAKAANVEK